jgi:hypothetical protein
MHAQHLGMIAALGGEPRRAAEDLGPVGGQPLDVLRMLVRVRERMVQLGIGQASGVMGPRQLEQRGVTAGELVQRGAHVTSVAQRAVIQRAADGTTTDTEAAKADADELES